VATRVSNPHNLQPSEIKYHRTLFYLGGVLVAGLLLPKGRVADQPNTQCPNKGAVEAPHGTANNSPFVQIYRNAQLHGVRECAQPFAAILLTSPYDFRLPIW
jgi:amino acid permease